MYPMYALHVSSVPYISIFSKVQLFCSFQLFKYYYHEEITAELLYYNANSAIKKQKVRKFTLMDIMPHANYSDLK